MNFHSAQTKNLLVIALDDGLITTLRRQSLLAGNQSTEVDSTKIPSWRVNFDNISVSMQKYREAEQLVQHMKSLPELCFPSDGLRFEVKLMHELAEKDGGSVHPQVVVVCYKRKRGVALLRSFVRKFMGTQSMDTELEEVVFVN